MGWPPAGPPVAAEPTDGPWGPGMRVPWGFWESVLVGVVGFLIGGVLAVPIIAGKQQGDLSDLQFAVSGILGELGLFLAAAGWIRLRYRRQARSLALDLRRPGDAAIGFGMGLVIYGIAVFGIGLVIEIVLQQVAGHQISAPDQVPSTLAGFPLVLTGFLVIVCAPIAEELLFRGMLFRSLRDRHGFWAGAIVSSVLFGSVHIQGWDLGSALLSSTLAFVGLGLAALYEWRRNIIANMAAHAAFNVVGFVLIVFGVIPLRTLT